MFDGSQHFLGRLLGVILTADGVAEATFPLLVGRLRDYGLQMEEEGPEAPAEGPLVGKTLVLTGTLRNLTRPDATARIEAFTGGG